MNKNSVSEWQVEPHAPHFHSEVDLHECSSWDHHIHPKAHPRNIGVSILSYKFPCALLFSLYRNTREKMTIGNVLKCILLCVFLFEFSLAVTRHEFSIREATIQDLQHAFKQNKLTSRELVEFYLREIQKHNPVLHGVIEVSPDGIKDAVKADQERKAQAPVSRFPLHGIPILLKDNIATKDKLNTTAGSYALLGSVVPRDAGVVTRLRNAGAIILGKASLSEWSYYRSSSAPSGWSARGGQGVVSFWSALDLGQSCGPIQIRPSLNDWIPFWFEWSGKRNRIREVLIHLFAIVAFGC